MANWRHLTIAGAGMVSAAITSPATAQSSGTSLGLTKSEAIIGGPSSLAEILTQQGAASRTSTVTPASYGLKRPFIRTATSSNAGSAALTGKPDIFGTVALRVQQTRLDQRWRRASGAAVSGHAASFASSLRNRDKNSRLDAINRYVNRRVRFTDDSRQYGKADVWTTANATLNRGRGDCEDYAIAKLQMLRAAGFSDRDLYFVILKDLVRRSDHAVLVVRSDERMVVLDNGTDQLLDSETVSDYRPILTFAENGVWTHGYRRRENGVEIAAVDTDQAQVAPAADGRLDQRSRNASLLALSTGFSR
jgi:predicted transglutaminase-like cysteine proteinase